MKIAYLSQVDLTRNYSGSVHIKEVVRGFINKGAEVWLFCQKGSDFLGNESKLHIVELGFIRGSFRDYLIYQVILAIKVLSLCMRERIDLMYVRSEAAMFSHIIVRLLIRKRYVLELNSWPFRDVTNVRSVGVMQLAIIKFLMWLSIRFAGSIICVTDTLNRKVRHNYPASSGKIFTVQNGANVELFTPRDQAECRRLLSINHEDFVLCYVAYFQYYNDVETIIKAMPKLLKEIPDLKFYLIGGWAQESRRKEVEDLVYTLGLDSRVKFVGEIEYEMIPLYICASDICCATFNQDVGDGSVMKVFEYLSCGKTVIASHIASLAFIEENECGINVSMCSVPGVFNAVKKLWRAPNFRQRAGNNGRRMIMEHFSWDASISKIWKTIQWSTIDKR